MNIEHTKFSGVKIYTPTIYRDNRGYFYESYSKNILPTIEFVQENHALSTYGIIRGLHYAINPGQAKLIRVTKGKILDIAVDIRPKSSTCGQWVGVEISDENKKQLFIPIGFAHGYAVLSDMAEVQYKCSALYDKDKEKGIIYNDPSIDVQWPIKNPIISERDTKNQSFIDYLVSNS